MSGDELRGLEQRVHEGITSIEYDRYRVPCILFPEQRLGQILRKVAGRPVSVDANLNILQDGTGRVFVEIVMTFSVGICEKVLLDAGASLDFFELLAETSMLALSSPRMGGEIFMIQLPRPEKAADALGRIRLGLKAGKKPA